MDLILDSRLGGGVPTHVDEFAVELVVEQPIESSWTIVVQQPATASMKDSSSTSLLRNCLPQEGAKALERYCSVSELDEKELVEEWSDRVGDDIAVGRLLAVLPEDVPLSAALVLHWLEPFCGIHPESIYTDCWEWSNHLKEISERYIDYLRGCHPSLLTALKYLPQLVPPLLSSNYEEIRMFTSAGSLPSQLITAHLVTNFHVAIMVTRPTEAMLSDPESMLKLFHVARGLQASVNFTPVTSPFHVL